MGARGPSPTPSRILSMRGSWRSAARGPEPEPPVEKIDAPSWLTPDAAAAFKTLATMLVGMGVLASIDANALARYVTIWVQWREAAAFVAKHGTTYAQRARPAWNQKGEGPVIGFRPYPQAKLMVELSTELLRLEREFGLTPSARARLAGDPSGRVDSGSEFDYYGERDELNASHG